MTNNGYATELQSLKNEISQLKTIITTAMEQIKQALASLPMPSPPTESNVMDTDVKQNMSSKPKPATNNPPPTQLDLPARTKK